MGWADALTVASIVVGLVVGLGGLSATIWAIGRVRGVETSIDILNAANDGLREANEDMRTKLQISEQQCAERISRLEGQNQALLDGLGERLAAAIAHRLETALTLAADRIVAGVAQRSTDRERRFGDSPQGGE